MRCIRCGKWMNIWSDAVPVGMSDEHMHILCYLKGATHIQDRITNKMREMTPAELELRDIYIYSSQHQ